MAELFVFDIPPESCGKHVWESTAAQGFVKQLLTQRLDRKEIVIERTERGKPFVSDSDIMFSWSHSAKKIAVALSENEVGVDIQLIGKRRQKVERRVFTEGEQRLINSSPDEDKAFFSLWVLKESYLKAIGTGFCGNAKEIEFFSLSPKVVSNKSNCRFALQNREDYLVAVCEIDTIRKDSNK